MTVVASAADGHVVATAVSDSKGGFLFESLRAGGLMLGFELADFEPASVAVWIAPDAEVLVSVPLRIGSVSELVVVRGDATPAAPVSAPIEIPRMPPPPQVQPVALDDLQSVCGPAKPGPAGAAFGSLQAHRHDASEVLYRLGDEVIVDGGPEAGFEVGQNLVARRYFRAPAAGGSYARGEHTAGVVQIVSTDAGRTTAVVIHACNELMRGDVLAPFRPEPAAVPEPVGTPRYQDAARVLFADAGQALGAARRLMVIDRGLDHGIRPGQRLTLFRPRLGQPGRIHLGQAIVIAVRADSARIRVESTTDAVFSGDLAAPQQAAPGLRALRP